MGADQLRQYLEPNILSLDLVMREMKPGVLVLTSGIISDMVSHNHRLESKNRSTSGIPGPKTVAQTS